MKSILQRIALGLFAVLAFSTFASTSVNAVTPNPVLIFMGQEPFSTGDNNFTRYRYGVFNFADIPNDLFAAAPSLPPCGLNNKSSRSWVDLFNQSGKRLNGFCALGKSSDLNIIWFALPDTEVPPSWIYIEINDRQTNTKYKSNLAETTL